MPCDYCSGTKAIFYHDKYDCVFIDADGTMRVYVDGVEAKFKVNRCPMCGRLFKGANDIDDQPEVLSIGDHVWYIDKEADEMFAEHCVVQHVAFDNGHIDWFAAKFDNGDVEDFGPCALGIHCFKSKESAELAWKLAHDIK